MLKIDEQKHMFCYNIFVYLIEPIQSVGARRYGLGLFPEEHFSGNCLRAAPARGSASLINSHDSALHCIL